MQQFFDELNAEFDRDRLRDAARNGDLGKVMKLLKDGYPINAFDDCLSWTPLHYAAKYEHLPVVRYLIKAGADINIREEEKIGDTVLASVAQTCSLEMATILVKAGADPTIPGWMGNTALDRSMRRKKPEGLQVHKLLCDATKRRHPDWPYLKRYLEPGKSRRQ